jgi:hypothetical protein
VPVIAPVGITTVLEVGLVTVTLAVTPLAVPSSKNIIAGVVSLVPTMATVAPTAPLAMLVSVEL